MDTYDLTVMGHSERWVYTFTCHDYEITEQNGQTLFAFFTHENPDRPSKFRRTVVGNICVSQQHSYALIKHH